jgi:two-component system NtrC family sensor kinase
MSSKITFELQNVLNAIPSVVVLVDTHKRIIGVNNFARRVFRKTELLGRECPEVFSCCEKRGNGCPVESLDYVIPAGIVKVRQKIRVSESEEDVRCRIIPARLDGPGSEHVFLHVVLDRDLIAREKLVELEKNLTITTLTAGIAHEFNNMNAGIYGLVELVLSQENLSRETAKDMSTILNIIKRASHLIDQLLIFANRKPSKHVLINLENIVDDCVKILRPELTSGGIAIEIIRRSTLEDMFLDANKVSLAIMNIIINARDAMIGCQEKKLRIEIGREEPFGFVRIHDTGTGIPAEYLDRIFEPFYTTKGSLGTSSIPGTGLGLSVAAGVIKEHNGIIEVESEHGRGSTLTVKLPLVTYEALDREISRNYNEYDFGGKNILVVDDEVELNNLLVRALASKNAVVKSAFTGAQALAHIELEPVDLMLLDIQMPDLNGWDVVEHLKFNKQRPKIIIISGNFLVMDAQDSRFVEKVLLKPFDLEELYRIVHEVFSPEKTPPGHQAKEA